MKQWIQRSFKNRIFLTIFIVSLLPLLLCDGILMRLIISRTEYNARNGGNRELQQIQQDLDGLLLDFESFLFDFSGSTLVRSILRSGSYNSRSLYQYLYQSTYDLKDYAQFYVYSQDGVCRYSTANASDIGDLDPDWGILRASAVGSGAAYQSDTEEGFLIAKTVTTRSGDILGYILVRMQRDDLTAFLDDRLGSANELFLLDKTWRSVYCTQAIRSSETVTDLREQLMQTGTLTASGEECYYMARRSEVSGFTLILQQPKIYTSQVIASIVLTSVAMGVLCLALCLWGSWKLSMYLAEPVQQLDAAMQQVERHNYQMQIESDRIDEIGLLAESFNRMTVEYCRNLEHSVQRQKELNETQLRMLQAQLNPHFLYNTLDSMKWLGITSHVPQIADMATNLAILLRMAISGKKMITVEEELDLIERYIDIQTIRYEDKFTCEIDVPEQFQHCMIPKLLLQPLVENAIVHGISDLEEGYIKICAEEVQQQMRISVYDNGCGMPEEALQRVNSTEEPAPTDHLGLYNVGHIIRLYFGDNYGIRAHTLPEGGTCIRIYLPMLRKEPEDAESIDR